jgi:hypothetical protein
VNPSNDLGQALADLATRADATQPQDRLDGIHRRARRTARTRVVGATLAAFLVCGSAAALIARSDNQAGPVGPATQQTATTPGPTTAATTSPTQPTPTSSRPNPTNATTTSARPTASSTSSLVPADAQLPNAMGCNGVAGAIATIDANPDVPFPRCIVVRADQLLRVVNTTNIHGTIGQPITVTFADYLPRVLQVGQATTFNRPLGEYLAVGVHVVHLSPLYAGGVAQVWLK